MTATGNYFLHKFTQGSRKRKLSFSFSQAELMYKSEALNFNIQTFV